MASPPLEAPTSVGHDHVSLFSSVLRLALLLCQSLVSLEGWEDVVTVVSADMRTWEAPELADILVGLRRLAGKAVLRLLLLGGEWCLSQHWTRLYPPFLLGLRPTPPGLLSLCPPLSSSLSAVLSPPPLPGCLQVSELLGSFGDNELSPECLDGAQRFLKPDGISIPAS